MNSVKPMQWVGIGVGLISVVFIVYSHLQSFGDVTFLGGILLLEVLVICLWNYHQRFFALLMIAFAWAGMNVPLEGGWYTGRWIVLAAGAGIGYIIWLKSPRRSFGLIHLIAFSCVFTAFVSATVSQYLQMASLKALSLLLLFLYCSAGARVAVLGREERFFRSLIGVSQIVVYFTAICYLGFGNGVWGNPNSLGAVMGVAVFPVLLWAWLTSHGPSGRLRRLVPLLLCIYLIIFSMARAAMISAAAVTLVLCFCIREYKVLVKAIAVVLFLAAVMGVLDPRGLNQKVGDLEDAILYKGHKDEGVLGSRQKPWDRTIELIKEHPMFGTGYGTSPTGEDPGLEFGRVGSSAETAREHGSSYMTITQWVGLLGVLPFLALVVLTVANVWRVCSWMRRTADPSHYSIPLAMVVFAGLIHASFEDWLFAVGYYLCVYFWFFAFLLADLMPEDVALPLAPTVSRASHPSPGRFEVDVLNPVVRNR